MRTLSVTRNIKKDDEVIFTYKNKEYTGKVMEHSSKDKLLLYNKCYMEKQLHMLRLEKAKKEKKVKKSESFNKTEVSLRKRNELGPSKIIKSSAKDITKKKNDTKKVLKKIQRTSNAAVFDLLDKYPTSELSDNASNSQKSSPTKEELKEMLYQIRKKLEERSIFEEKIEKKERKIEKDFCDLNSSDENNLEINVENPDKNSIKNSVTNIENNLENFEDENEIEELENADIQLYGKDFESKMIHLKNNFYCRNAMFYSAIGNAHRPSQLVRRLLTGVFKKKH
ncbi:uncharacterized protein LOC120357144 isoform X1 [Solenopsis invicta]|uniref:uncharacterized protein LOC120357144 isoform X1 n=1 Tax=Solenopsis invicta TaxID=13686 RepID=UPI00193DC456|nr:uncharacterized protein LOC120357144 isoform X1 [Solenopsis invicta]